MPSYYEAVGEEPTYELAEGIIKAFIRDLKEGSDYVNDFPNASGYIEYPRGSLEYRRLSRGNRRKDTSSALQVIIKHFPEVLIKSETSIYIKDSTKHTLNANDLLIMDYYLTLLNEYAERVNKYQQYLKRQQYKQQRNKLLFVLFLPFILFVLMILVGD